MKHQDGYTLIELMIAVAISGIVMIGFYSAFSAQHRSYNDQGQINIMQQNIRGAMLFMSERIRMAGYDPFFTDADGDGFDDNRLLDGLDNDADGIQDLADNADDVDYVPPGLNEREDVRFGITAAGPYSLTFSMDIHDNIDNDIDGTTDEWDEIGNPNGTVNEADENITFSFGNDPYGGGAFDADNNGVADGRFAMISMNGQPLAENIYAIGFAYAFDSPDDTDGDGIPGDGILETTDGTNLIYAIDLCDTTHNLANPAQDGILDYHFDTNGDGVVNNLDWDINGDGVVDGDDDTNVDGLIDYLDGVGGFLTTNNNGTDISDTGPNPITVSRIRVVRISLLGVTRREVTDTRFAHNNTQFYSVGHRAILPFRDPFTSSRRLRLLTTTVKCRNTGLF